MDIIEGTKYSRGELRKINRQLKEEGKKYCGKCLKIKNIDDFHWNNKKKGYKQPKCNECNKKWREENKEHKKKYDKKWYEENKEHRKKYNNLPTKSDIYFDHLLPYYKDRISRDNDGYIEVKCEYNGCRKWFKPTRMQLKERWRAICGKCSIGSENNIYCSDECKSKCDKYGHPWRFKDEDDIDKDGNNRVPYEWARRVKERDNRTCQECGKTEKDGIELHAHHMIPRGTCTMLEADVDNGITLCRECHHEKHCIEGCGYNYLAREDKEVVQKDTIAA